MNPTIGVYFRREDYASFWVRVFAGLVDFVVFGAFCVGLAVVILMVFPPNKTRISLILLASLGAWFLYFVVVKGSRFRTLEYRLGRVKIVGLDGQAPSSKSLMWRALFGILGLLYFLNLLALFNYTRALFGVLAPLSYLDLIWLLNDTHRQALRDKFAGTYVVKKDSQPPGKGRIVYRMYELALYNFMFREVEAGMAAQASE